MATIRLTVLNSIKESNGKLPILICISQKKDRAYIKKNSYLMIFPNLKTGELCTERMPELLINAYSLYSHNIKRSTTLYWIKSLDPLLYS